MTLVLRVHGVQDCISAFRDLPRSVRNRNMRIALNAGAGVIRDAAAANIKSESGLLKKSLKIKVRVPDASYNQAHHGNRAYAVIGPSRSVVGRVGVSYKRGERQVKTLTVKQAIRGHFGRGGFSVRRPARYAHLVEKGTKAHGIAAKNAKVLGDGGRFFGKSVKHPGTKPQSFLGKAVRSSGDAAQNKILRKLHDGITNWAAARSARVRSTRVRSTVGA